MRIPQLFVAVMVTLLLYAVLNFLILQRPVTLGYILAAYQHKERFAAQLDVRGGPKILLMAGSNGIYSHRCQTISQVTGIPCVNFAVSYVAGIETILAKPRPYVHSGDVVLMPLEFGFYNETETDIVNDVSSNRYLALYDRSLIRNAQPRRLAAILFSLSVRDIFTSLGEMGFARAGILRDTDRYRMDEEGDITGHTADNARIYSDYLAQQKAAVPASSLSTKPYGGGSLRIRQAVRDFTAAGARVVGLLPTSFDDATISADYLTWFSRLYESGGGKALMLPNRSRYPRSMFYNTPYHLNEEAQIAHSRLTALALCDQLLLAACRTAWETPVAFSQAADPQHIARTFNR